LHDDPQPAARATKEGGGVTLDTPTADQIAAADDMADYAVTHADELAALDALERTPINPAIMECVSRCAMAQEGI
jgi:hypothetical protein